jgi:D-alanyl-D-alanine carboxypeptidase
VIRLVLAAFALMSSAISVAAPAPIEPSVEHYVRPYVDTRNFSGVVLVARDANPLFSRAYGLSDRDRHTPNALNTRFHIASMSMQFTAAAVMRLANAGRLSLDTPVSAIVPGYPNGSAITVRHLLTQTSGVADINAQDDYSDILKAHQTPQSLVARMHGVAPLRAP